MNAKIDNDNRSRSELLNEIQQLRNKVSMLENSQADDLDEFSKGRVGLYDSRKEALNLMEDAIFARNNVEIAHKKLLESEERLRFHIENTPLAVVEWNNNFVVTRWTGQSEKIFGWKSSETLGKPLADLKIVYSEDLHIVQDTMEKLKSGDSRYVVSTNRNVTKSGEIRVCTWYNTILLDADGNLHSVMSLVLDVTQSKRAEERLNLLADTAGLLLVADSPKDAVESLCARALSVLDCHVFFNFLDDRYSGLLRLNACSGITDEEKEKVCGLDDLALLCGCVADDGNRVIAEDILNLTDTRTELLRSLGVNAFACHPLKRGEEVLGTLAFGSRTRPCFSNDDISVMKTMSDLLAIAIERKKTGESLERAKREWERTFDSVPDLIAILDQNYRFIRVNSAMAEHLNMKPKDCIGMLCHKAIHGTDIPHCFCPHTKTLNDGNTHEVELSEENLGGDFLVSTTPLFDNAGELIGTVHMARDISDRKRAEDALRKVNDELELRVRERTSELAGIVEVLQQEVIERIAAQEALNFESEERIKAVERLREQEKFLVLQSRHAAMGEMIGNIAHQWRQPLNILGLLIQQIQMFHEAGKFDANYLDQSVRKGMEIIQHMSRTIDDFRDFFRPDKQPVAFSVSDSIEKTISLVRESFASNLIYIESRLNCECMINGYSNEFSQAILNILINARDVLMERKVGTPVISIRVGCENGRCIIQISDNAGGIEDDIVDKVFDPYFTTKSVQQGTGLGLYMAKTIIEKNMSGMLTVKNEAEGAVFRIEVAHVDPK